MRPFLVMGSAVAALAAVAATGQARAEEWMLMGREGGCVTIAEAAERHPLLNGITTPDQLLDRLRAQGEDVHRQDHVFQGDITIVQIDAPGRELGLLFAPASACR